MTSAMGMQHMVIEAMKAGASDFVVKPFKPEQLIAALEGKTGGISVPHRLFFLRTRSCPVRRKKCVYSCP